MNTLEIINYSNRAIVVTGDTKPVKDRLKSIGGRFNPRLTHPQTKETLIGWVFRASDLKIVQGVLMDAKRDNLVSEVKTSLPANINDKTEFVQDPGEVDEDNFNQRQEFGRI